MTSVLFEIRNNIGFITLNRPDKLNVFNREMALLLQHKLDECASLKEVRAVYITGAGKGFCAGQDLAEVVDPTGPGMDTILSEHYNPIITRIRNIPKPVVAAKPVAAPKAAVAKPAVAKAPAAPKVPKAEPVQGDA